MLYFLTKTNCVKIKILIIIALCFGFSTFGATPSPLAVYSTQWNYPMFEKANTAANVSYLSKEEKEFIYVLNLARMNPYLFAETVLKPFAKTNGYSFQIVNMMEQMKYARATALLSAHNINKQELNNWVDSIQLFNYEKADILYQKTKLKNTVYFISPATNTVDLLCRMIADANAGVHSIRNLILSANNTICISIKKENNFITALNFDERTTDQIESYLAQKENDRLKEKALNRKFINYLDCKDDSVFQFFIKEQNIDIKNAVFVSPEEISKIKDSIIESKMNINIHERSANVEVIKNVPKKKNALPKYNYFIWSYFYSDESVGNYDTEKQLHFYTFCRSIPDSAGEQSNVIFKEIKTPILIPPFPLDSIGNTAPAIDDNKVDNYSKSIGTLPIKQLAIALTKPWKNEAEKVRAIFKWMDYNLQYDYQGLANGKMTTEPNEVLLKKVAVCQGYAELFSALCDAVGIRNVLISGVAKKSKTSFPGHAWNAVCINKKWFLIDVTWGEEFYLKTPQHFFNDHFPKQNRWTLFPEFHSFKEFKEDKAERF